MARLSVPKSKNPGRVSRQNLFPLGFRDVGQDAARDFAALWIGRLGVWIVAAPGQGIDADDMTVRHGCRILLKAGEDVRAEVVARQPAVLELLGPRRAAKAVGVGVIELEQEVGNPTELV